MRRTLKRRQRGQTIALAAVAMVALVGGLAIVIDAGIFMVVQRQLQTAADAGALAGAWYDPVCVLDASDCRGTAGQAVSVATSIAQANTGTIKPLCGGLINVDVHVPGPIVNPHVNTLVVTASCDAGYSFGRILNLTTKPLTASAAAAMGDRNATNPPTCDNGGDMTNFSLNPPPLCGRLARLIV